MSEDGGQPPAQRGPMPRREIRERLFDSNYFSKSSFSTNSQRICPIVMWHS